jgi:hypothetical protein
MLSSPALQSASPSLALPAEFGTPTVDADFSALSQSQEEGIRKRIAFFKKYRFLWNKRLPNINLLLLEIDLGTRS